jgi:Rieske Fe-S protein
MAKVSTMTQVSRRTVTGLATAGLSLPLLAACGDDGDAATDPGGASAGSTTPSSDASTPSGTESASGGGDALASTSDIEVGGGAIFADEQVVVTQPSEGEFKCFNSTCTHQGCQVDDVSDGEIHCPCHKSRFSIETGEPLEGSLAQSPLEEVAFSVEGDSIVLA